MNGSACLHISYQRQLNDEPVVQVNQCSFAEDDRRVTLSMSHRMEDEAAWAADFASALGTFRLE